VFGIAICNILDFQRIPKMKISKGMFVTAVLIYKTQADSLYLFVIINKYFSVLDFILSSKEIGCFC
jgi:hypothetical protein